MARPQLTVLIVFLAGLVVACSSGPKDTPEGSFKVAITLMKNENYEEFFELGIYPSRRKRMQKGIYMFMKNYHIQNGPSLRKSILRKYGSCVNTKPEYNSNRTEATFTCGKSGVIFIKEESKWYIKKFTRK